MKQDETKVHTADRKYIVHGRQVWWDNGNDRMTTRPNNRLRFSRAMKRLFQISILFTYSATLLHFDDGIK
jgi:hypothetical protein